MNKWLWGISVFLLAVRLGLLLNLRLGVNVDQILWLRSVGLYWINETVYLWGVWLLEVGLVTTVSLTAKKLMGDKSGAILALLLTCSSWVNWVLPLGAVPSSDDNLMKLINSQTLSTQVDLRQKEIFMATNKTILLPAWFRKIWFNKLTLGTEVVAKRTVELIDFEQLVNPSISWEAISKSALPPKGLLPMFYIWEIPLLAWVIVEMWRQQNPKSHVDRGTLIKGLLLLLVLLPAIYWHKKYLVVSGIGVLLFIYWHLAKYLTHIPDKILKLVTLCYLISLALFWRLEFGNQSGYRSSIPRLYREIAEFVKQSPTTSEFRITTRFGPTEEILTFYQAKGKVIYGEINRDEEIKAGVTYIGLPGEIGILPSLKKEKVIDGWDSPVYKFGEGIWIAKQ